MAEVTITPNETYWWQIVNNLNGAASDFSYGRVPENPEQFENGRDLCLEAAHALTREHQRAEAAEDALREAQIRSRYAHAAARDASYRIEDREQRAKIRTALARLSEIDSLARAVLTESEES
jgi:hypothetical protein